MDYSNRICQTLHDEHMATLALLERLERFANAGAPPAGDDSAARNLLADFSAAFEHEIRRHFAFEEKYLFGYFADAGEAEMAKLLADEHVLIRGIGGLMLPLVRAAAPYGFSPSAWNEFSPLARQFAEQLATHAQKEEGVLVPLLEDSMDGETEERLYRAYVMNEEEF